MSPVSIGDVLVNDCVSDAIEIDDAILLARGGLVWRDYFLPGNKIHYWPTAWRSASWLPGIIIDEHTIKIHEEFLSNVDIISQLHFHIDTGIAKDNFGHFIHDTLSYLYAYENATTGFGEIPFASFGLRFPNCLKIFKLVFGRQIGEANLHPGKSTLFRKLIVPRRQSVIQEDGRFELSFRSLRAARDRIHSHFFESGNRVAPEYDLFVHRSPGRSFGSRSVIQGRDFGNTFEFLNDMSSAGFVCVEPGGLNLPTLAHLFCNARQVVGVHGAGLANILLLPEQRSVIEIRSHEGNWRSIEAVAAALERFLI